MKPQKKRLHTDFKKEIFAIMSELCTQFAYKQDWEFNGFIGDNPLDYACFQQGEITVSAHDILHDMHSKQKPGTILEWMHLEKEEIKPNYIHFCAQKKHGMR